MRSAHFNAFYHSLHFRLTLWNTAVVLLALLLTLLAVRHGVRVALMRDTDEHLREETVEIRLAIGELYPDVEQIHVEMNRKALGHHQHGLFVQLADADNKIVWSSVNTPDEMVMPAMPTDASFSLQTVGDVRLAQQKLNKAELPHLIIRVGSSLKSVDADVARLTDTMLFVGAVMLLLAPLGGHWLASRATQPLAAINNLATTLQPSKLDDRLPILGSGDELDVLSDTINRLLDRIANYLNRNRQFVANAAHELRSPLAAIQSSVEVALNNDRSIDEYKDLLGEIVEECGELRLLVNQLLLLAEADGEVLPQTFETVNLAKTVSKAVDMFRDAAEEQGVRLTADRIEPVQVHGHSNRLRQVVNNLIDNAIKFNKPGGCVTLDLRSVPSENAIRLKISDTGRGIAPEDLPRVFDRFYRANQPPEVNSRNGNGLGLAICSAILAGYGGTIEVNSKLGVGTSFIVKLPIHVPQEDPLPVGEELDGLRVNG